jgi:hypothetical protein
MASPFGVEHYPIDPTLPSAPARSKQGRFVDLALGSIFFATIAIATCGWLYVLFLLIQTTAIWLWT